MLIARTLMDSLQGSADFVLPTSLTKLEILCVTHPALSMKAVFEFCEQLFYLSAVHPATHFVQHRYNEYCKNAASKPGVLETFKSGFEVERNR